MSRPTILHVGGTLYWVIRTFDSSGELVDADSTPTVSVRKQGSPVGDSVTVTKRSATTGIYDCEYDPAGEAEGDKFTIEETAVLGTVSYPNSWEFVVVAVERGTDGANTTEPPDSADIGQEIAYQIAVQEGDWPAALLVIKDGLATAAMFPADFYTLTISSGGVAVAGDVFGNSLALQSTLNAVGAALVAVGSVTEKIDTMLVENGAVWQYSVNSHGLIPSGGATPAEVWSYFVDATGDAAAAKIGQSSASAVLGTGDRPVTVTVTDNHVMPVRFATVNIYDASGEPLGIYGATDLHGEAQFQLNAGTYVVAIGSLAGFDSHTPQEITVAGGPLEVPVMLTRSPTVAPSNPALCVVRCRIVNAGGQPLRNAIVEAIPLSKTTAYDQVLVTLVVTSATTNEEGYCELVLPRAASLIGDDNKRYRFTVRYETRAVFATFVGLVPDASEAWLEDILNP